MRTGDYVVVDIGALIQGPVFIDDNSYIAPGAKIRPGTFIGKNCKVGGEVSCSIFSKYFTHCSTESQSFFSISWKQTI